MVERNVDIRFSYKKGIVMKNLPAIIFIAILVMVWIKVKKDMARDKFAVEYPVTATSKLP